MRAWKHNHLDEEYEFIPKEMVDRFFASKYFRDWKRGLAFNLDRSFLLFISVPEPGGIDTYIEPQDVETLLNMIHSDPRRNQ